MSSLTINFTPSTVPPANGYIVSYRVKGSTGAYTIVTPNPTTSPVIITTGILANTDYEGTIQSSCSNGLSTVVNWQALSTSWVPDTYTCEQDSVFSLQSQITNLSSPGYLMYDPTSALVYGIDLDSTTGHFFSFNPSTAAASTDITYYTGYNSDYVYSYTVDPTYRRLYGAGKHSGGLKVYDIAGNTITTVPYGQDDTGQGNGYNRLMLYVGGNYIYAANAPNYGNSITLINRSTLTVASDLAITSIPSGTNFLGTASPFLIVNNEIWTVASQMTGSPNIARYSLDLTTLNGTIDISAYSSVWSGGYSKYWRATYYDSDNHFFYVIDYGTNNIIIVDTTTQAVVSNFKITNLQGKTTATVAFVQDPITGDLFITGTLVNSTTDSSSINITYSIDRVTHQLTQVYKDTSFSNLVQVGSSNILYGAFPGYTAWSGTTGYGTDGKLLKYSR